MQKVTEITQKKIINDDLVNNLEAALKAAKEGAILDAVFVSNDPFSNAECLTFINADIKKPEQLVGALDFAKQSIIHSWSKGENL